jgi:nucleoid-associated protein YgaU
MGISDFFKKGKEEPVEKPNSEVFGDSFDSPSFKDEPTYYEIKSGDSLSKIAQEQLGDPQRWKEIYEANSDEIKNPNLIYPGQKIKIPQDSSRNNNSTTDSFLGG